MQTRSLAGWLEYLERLHPVPIAMGLDRVAQVRAALGLALHCPVVTVGGTNGKGSTCAFMEAMLRHAGYRVGCYTSPHLLRYNERVRVDGQDVSDAALCDAFDRVERGRAATPLTYFEFGTLAAIDLFNREGVEIAILEVGLGGRLDAVNAFDPDCAVVTGVAMDHMDYLGDTREQIGFEKAGIFRPGKPAVCADRDPPAALVGHAQAIGAKLILLGRDFDYSSNTRQWQYQGPGGRRAGLPHPSLRGNYQLSNASAAITALDTMRMRIPLGAQDVRGGLVAASVPGRFQVLAGRPVRVIDVAHNPQAAAALAMTLNAMGRFRSTIAVFSMLRDKDITAVAAEMRACVTHWHVTGTPGPRGASADTIVAALRSAGVDAPIEVYPDIAGAFDRACERAGETDRIVAFGSFLTVASVLRHCGERRM